MPDITDNDLLAEVNNLRYSRETADGPLRPSSMGFDFQQTYWSSATVACMHNPLMAQLFFHLSPVAVENLARYGMALANRLILKAKGFTFAMGENHVHFILWALHFSRKGLARQVYYQGILMGRFAAAQGSNMPMEPINHLVPSQCTFSAPDVELCEQPETMIKILNELQKTKDCKEAQGYKEMQAKVLCQQPGLSASSYLLLSGIGMVGSPKDMKYRDRPIGPRGLFNRLACNLFGLLYLRLTQGEGAHRLCEEEFYLAANATRLAFQDLLDEAREAGKPVTRFLDTALRMREGVYFFIRCENKSCRNMDHYYLFDVERPDTYDCAYEELTAFVAKTPSPQNPVPSSSPLPAGPSVPDLPDF